MATDVRVLHVIDHLTGGGAESSLRSFLAASADCGLEQGVVVLDGAPDSRAIASELVHHSWAGPPSSGIRPGDRRLVRQAMAGFEPHVVHSSLYRSMLAASMARPRRPHIHTLTSTEYAGDAPGLRGRQRLGLQASHWLYGRLLGRRHVTIHAVSESVRQAAMERFGISSDRFVVIPRGRPDPAAASLGDPVATRRALGVAAAEVVAIAVAREHPIKNHIALLEAVAALRLRGVDARLLLVGPCGDASTHIYQAIGALSLGEATLRLGQRDDVPDLLGAADIFVSTSFSEGMPGSIIEALASRVPVAAFRAPGVTDALGEDHVGLVPFGDHQALADRIDCLSRPGEARDTAIAVGRRRYLSEFSMDKHVARMSDLYRSLAVAHHVSDGRRRHQGDVQP